MTKPYEPILTTIPRFEIKCVGWDHLEVFENQIDAYKCLFDFALRYPNTEFWLVKKINWEEEVLCKFKMSLTDGLNNIQPFYKSMLELCQEKLNDMVTWRKIDGS